MPFYRFILARKKEIDLVLKIGSLVDWEKRGTGLICCVKLVYWLIKLIKLIGWMEALGLRFEVGGKI
jgi:hypothetical protein